ncbi:hybrid sensor histidine kinase/response regulator [Tautonia rosea]|uniref:hybrid sensor histidine kinase/response regulator n=1 Tax=Tautonia rosea TaxID=2728037 RepID=UPI0014751317|nr:hybrid sensor histidine kinase/response regulator [Tautonia rosea]
MTQVVDPQLLRLIKDHPHGILVVASDSGRIVHANTAARFLLRDDPEAAIDGDLLGIPVHSGQSVLVEAGPPTRRRLRMKVEQVCWAGRQEQFITLREVRSAHRPRRRGDASRGPDRAMSLLAHELRSPLSAMLGALHAARLNPSTQQGVLVFVEHQARRLGRLLEDLVEGEVSDGRSIPIRPVMITVNRLVSWSAEAIRPLVAARGQQLEVRLTEEPILLAVDPTWIEQAFLHLLVNASKYSEVGGNIRMEVLRDPENVVISIRDDGIGIPSTDLGRIFNPFRRGDSDRVRLREGQGVGLAMVHRIIARHGGNVSAASPGSGQGSTFTIRLPIASVGTASPTPPVAWVDHPQPPLRSSSATSILIVDDDEAAAEGLAMVLRLWGCEVRMAFDGNHALRDAIADPPDILVIDRALPGIDGESLARRLREITATASALLICLTGSGWQPDPDADPFDHHLLKPIDFEALAQLIPTPKLGRPESDR